MYFYLVGVDTSMDFSISDVSPLIFDNHFAICCVGYHSFIHYFHFLTHNVSGKFHAIIINESGRLVRNNINWWTVTKIT